MPHFKVKLVLCILALLVVVPVFSGCGRPHDLDDRMREAAGDFRFSIFNWEVKTLSAEVGSIFRRSPADTGNPGVDVTLLESRIRAAFAAQGIYNPADRFFTLKFCFPPVYVYIGKLPRLLIVSPRDRIEDIGELTLLPDITVEDMEAIEAELEDLGYSAVVDDLGGISTFPSYVTSDADMKFICETTAHEWLHLYLTFTPLGFIKLLDVLGIRQDYDVSTMNETVADIVGREIGDMVYNEYYAPPPSNAAAPAPEPEEPGFDFNKAMREIRLTVDDLLAQGKIDEAEQYMNEQRRYLEDNGYYIRKLNQAYFAFHGAYADSPASVSPIGEKLRQLREQSASLKDFLNKVASMSSRADLDKSVP